MVMTGKSTKPDGHEYLLVAYFYFKSTSSVEDVRFCAIYCFSRYATVAGPDGITDRV